MRSRRLPNQLPMSLSERGERRMDSPPRQVCHAHLRPLLYSHNCRDQDVLANGSRLTHADVTPDGSPSTHRSASEATGLDVYGLLRPGSPQAVAGRSRSVARQIEESCHPPDSARATITTTATTSITGTNLRRPRAVGGERTGARDPLRRTDYAPTGSCGNDHRSVYVEL